MDAKRVQSSDSFSDMNSQKRRRTVSPIRQKHFDPLQYCQKMLTEFRTDTKHSAYTLFFQDPVDPVFLGCPTYFDVIKHPIDLSAIKVKFDNKEYKTEDDFAFDMRLMFENCYTFNGVDHKISEICKQFQDVFEEKFSRLKKAKEKSKFTIIEKINQKEAELKLEISKHEAILEDLKQHIEVIVEQRKEEELKLTLNDGTEVASQKPKKEKKLRGPRIARTKKKEAVQKKKKAATQKRKRQATQELMDESIDTEPMVVKTDSEEEDVATSMTYDEMRTLSLNINKLSPDLVKEVIKIVQKCEPNKIKEENGEVEIEFQTLKPITLRSLEKFIQDLNKPKPEPRQRAKGKFASAPNNAQQLEDEKKKLLNQLENIDNQLGLKKKPKTPPPPPPPSSSSSSSSSDSSSSSSGSSSDTLASSSDKIQSAKASGKPFRGDQRYVDVYHEKQIRVVVKVIVPVKEYPKFNFVGKLLGPKGNSMRRLQEETLCKMAILGRGSMKDKKREEELRQAADPKYAHLNDDLHVEISAIGSPSECYARMAFALAEVRKYLIPDSNDTIRQEQLREIMEGGLGEAAIAKIKQKSQYKSHVSTSERSIPRSSVPPQKTKILSILDRARIAMEESYKAEPSTYHEHHAYEESYETHHHHPYTEYSHAVHRAPSYRYEQPAAEYHQHQYHHPRETSHYTPVKSRSSWKESARESRHSHSRSEHSERISSSRYRHEPYTRIPK